MDNQCVPIRAWGGQTIVHGHAFGAAAHYEEEAGQLEIEHTRALVCESDPALQPQLPVLELLRDPVPVRGRLLHQDEYIHVRH